MGPSGGSAEAAQPTAAAGTPGPGGSDLNPGSATNSLGALQLVTFLLHPSESLSHSGEGGLDLMS